MASNPIKEETIVGTGLGTTAERDALMAEIEGLWASLDEILASLGPRDWSRRHGKTWSYADLPYHLAYFDKDLGADALMRGADAAASERWLMRCEAEVDAWNARKFAERPASQTVEQSLAQMRASRDAFRQAVANLSDDDLDRCLCWSNFFGWQPARLILLGVGVHTWSHFTELRLRLKRSRPLPPAALTHRALGFFLGMLPMTFDQTKAAGIDFTAVMEFGGPGGGAWTVHAADGICWVNEGPAERPNLVLTQSPETFVASWVKMQNPMLAMLTGKIKVRGFRQLSTFGKLFPQPKLDQQWGVDAEPKLSLA